MEELTLFMNLTHNASGGEDPAVLLRGLSQMYATKFLSLICAVSVLMIVGFVGNGIVVYVYWVKVRWTAKSIFILALATTDLIVCSFVIPVEIYDLTHQFSFYSANLCKAFRFVEYTMVLSGGFTLVAVSFERYCSICRTFTEFTPRKAKGICIAVVASALTLATPAVILAGSKQMVLPVYNTTGYECAMDTIGHNAEKYKKIYYSVLTGVFLCCCIMFAIIYSMIGTILCRMKKGNLIKGISMDTLPGKTSSSPNSGTVHPTAATDSQMHVHGRRKLKSPTTAVFFSVTVVFVVSFLPHIGTRLVQFLNIPLVENMAQADVDLMYNILVRSYLISNATNPFIYSIMNAKFRTELVKTFKRFCGNRSKSKEEFL